MQPSQQRILIVAENTSARMGGEAILPLHYFTRLRARGLDVWLITHERVKDELTLALGADIERVQFIRDTPFQAAAYRFGTRFPKRIADVTVGALIGRSTGVRMRKLARETVRAKGITVVHQPSPVSPKLPSHIYDVGAPTVIGPMNGGMTFPPAFRQMASKSERLFVSAGRKLAYMANLLVPGKRRASLLLVANQRTRDALPPGLAPRVIELVENGVDHEVWSEDKVRATSPQGDAPADLPVFCFFGFLKDMKVVDIAIDAAAIVLKTRRIRLDILGDGPERARLEAQVARLGLQDNVRFLGFVPQKECPGIIVHVRALLMPSVHECGGAVVLEAMALGVPVVATRWGGMADYLDDSTGILIDPVSREAMVQRYAEAMTRLADDAQGARELGLKGQKRALEVFTWKAKIEQILKLYATV
jgi:glycosyltransferase involved in cell wall biosynthesis